ncbi:hypothetical protein [Arthrobacter globiformis]|uniref:hypothetical protein n=1 Tax=Arthrobacter globiformis TaxID=1665 RepID=UPI0027D7E517|nr:hypothetical protein [Arthrobacter globiformis]
MSVIRADRVARLDAAGRTAASNLVAGASQTTAGDAGLARAAGGTAGTGGHGHGGALLDQGGWPQPANLTWGDVVVVEVEVHNGGPQPVLFSPGELRLRLAPSGTTVTAQDSDRSLGVVEPQTTEHMLISSLAPRDSGGLELEHSDSQRDQPVRLALPPLNTSEALS